jgi:hypothetical protein
VEFVWRKSIEAVIGADYANGTGIEHYNFQASAFTRRLAPSGMSMATVISEICIGAALMPRRIEPSGASYLKRGCNMGSQRGCDKLKKLR